MFGDTMSNEEIKEQIGIILRNRYYDHTDNKQTSALCEVIKRIESQMSDNVIGPKIGKSAEPIK